MFIYTCRAGTIRFFAVVLLAAAVLAALVIFVPAYQPVAASGGTDITVSYIYTGIKTNEDRIKFLSQFGYEVSDDPIETAEVTLPAKFDKVYAGYAELQKAQGLDISKYRRKTLTRYTYEVNNYDGYDGRVLANILVYRGRVVGGDICSEDHAGFVHGFAGELKTE